MLLVALHLGTRLQAEGHNATHRLIGEEPLGREGKLGEEITQVDGLTVSHGWEGEGNPPLKLQACPKSQGKPLTLGVLDKLVANFHNPQPAVQSDNQHHVSRRHERSTEESSKESS